MVFVGPGLTAGGTFDQIGSQVDIMPTILGLAGLPTPDTMDGRSVAPELIKKGVHGKGVHGKGVHAELPAQTLAHLTREWARKEAGSRPAWRTDVLIEYYGLGNVVRYNHLEDTFNNTFRALRSTAFAPSATIFNPTAGSNSTVNSTAFSNILYAEFTDVRTDYNFTATPEFYELFDMDADPHMLKNAYKDAPAALKTALHTKVLALFKCRGSPDSATAGDCN
jgi:hypothetical protein